MTNSIRYKSTRGKQSGLKFEEVVLGGLATDKGLFIPETIPTFSMHDIENVSLVLHYLILIFTELDNE